MERPPPRLAGVVSAAAVVLSLIFVGYEIRQNSAAVRGATYQSVMEASVGYAEWVASDERVAGLVVRVMNGEGPEDFSEEENLAITGIYYSGIRRAQNVYLQATALGLGTTFVGAFSDGAVADVLELADDHEPLGIMPVGWRR